MTWHEVAGTDGLPNDDGELPLTADTSSTRSSDTDVRKFSVRLPGWQRTALYAIGIVVALSGLLWFGLELQPDSDDIFSAWLTVERINRTLHGVTSLLMLAAIGSMLPVHVRLGWRGMLNRISGAALLATLALLALTGAALYYVADETVRGAMIWIHEIVGVASIVICIVHRRARLRR